MKRSKRFRKMSVVALIAALLYFITLIMGSYTDRYFTKQKAAEVVCLSDRTG